MGNKYYISAILNKTGVRIAYKNGETARKFALPTNDIDHSTSSYIPSSDYLTNGDLIPLSSKLSESTGIKISVWKDGVPDLLVYRKDDNSIQLAKAAEQEEWTDVSGQNINGLKDGERFIMQLEIVGNECQVQIWPDKQLQPSGGYVTSAAWPRGLSQIGKLVVST